MVRDFVLTVPVGQISFTIVACVSLRRFLYCHTGMSLLGSIAVALVLHAQNQKMIRRRQNHGIQPYRGIY